MQLSIDSFAHRCKIARVDVGLTQRQLAKKVGISHVMIGHYERGRSSPSVRRSAQVAYALGVNPEWLVFGAGAMR